MKIEITDTFFDNVKQMVNREKWYWKTWDFLRYDMPRFLKNLWLFRKDLYNYRWYSGQQAVLPFMKTALVDMASNTDVYGMEIEISKSKKVMKMWRAAKLMEHFIEDNFIELAEEELGELIMNRFEFEPVPDKPGYNQLIEKDTPEEEEHNTKIFARAREIEESMWSELWDILKGQNPAEIKSLPEIDEDAYDKWYDGSGLRNWWD
jgi:hypothetical protein